MANSDPDHATKIKSLIEDIEQRIESLKHFDAASEVNSHCDDLVGQVMLTIESAMKHLTKVQTRMVNEINDYRKDLLDATDSSSKKHSDVQEEFKKLSQEAATFTSKASTSTASSTSTEAFKKVNDLKERTNKLRKQMRANAFDDRFKRLIESDFLNDDIIGSLVETQKDVQDDFAIKHTVLDDLPSPFLSLDPFSQERVSACCFLRDGKLAIGASTGPIVIWDLAANNQLFQLNGGSKSCVTAIAQLPNDHLVGGNSLGSINVWDFGTKKHLKEIKCGEEEVLWLKVLPNGHVAVCCAEIYIWDLSKNNKDSKRSRDEPVAKFGIDLSELYGRYLEWRGRAPSGSLLSKSCCMNIHDLGVDTEWDENPEMTLEYNFEALSNGHVALACLEPDFVEITIWNPDNGRVIDYARFEGDDIKSCSLLPTGDAVICRKDGQVEIYSLEDEMAFHSFRNKKGPILAIQQQSKHSLQFVHLKDPKRAKHLGSQLISGCFSYDGKFFAAGGDGSKLDIWQLQP